MLNYVYVREISYPVFSDYEFFSVAISHDLPYLKGVTVDLQEVERHSVRAGVS